MRGFPPGCLALLLFFFLIILIPFFLAEVIFVALPKLGLNAQQSVIAVISIFIGSMVNIPATRFENQSQIQDTASCMLVPLIGADLLHINEIKKMGTLIASIGGGTFYSIVLSGIVATLLA